MKLWFVLITLIFFSCNENNSPVQNNLDLLFYRDSMVVDQPLAFHCIGCPDYNCDYTNLIVRCDVRADSVYCSDYPLVSDDNVIGFYTLFYNIESGIDHSLEFKIKTPDEQPFFIVWRGKCHRVTITNLKFYGAR